MFGESDYERRDWTMGLAGLLAGLHSLRILAERGLASDDDISASLDGVRAMLARIPEGSTTPDVKVKLDDLMSLIEATAVGNEGFEANV